MSHADPGFGIDVHWPFCRAICPYCDFNGHVERRGRPRAVGARWWPRSSAVPQRSGGARSLDLLRRRHAVADGAGDGQRDDRAGDRLLRAAPDLEVTLEANPTSSRAFRALHPAGVNRISLGIQALDDAVLRLLGRQHSAAKALAAVDLAARLLARFSFDLIYGPLTVKVDQRSPPPYIERPRQPIGIAPFRLALHDKSLAADRELIALPRACDLARAQLDVPVSVWTRVSPKPTMCPGAWRSPARTHRPGCRTA